MMMCGRRLCSTSSELMRFVCAVRSCVSRASSRCVRRASSSSGVGSCSTDHTRSPRGGAAASPAACRHRADRSWPAWRAGSPRCWRSRPRCCRCLARSASGAATSRRGRPRSRSAPWPARSSLQRSRALRDAVQRPRPCRRRRRCTGSGRAGHRSTVNFHDLSPSSKLMYSSPCVAVSLPCRTVWVVDISVLLRNRSLEIPF